eukprot:1293019-Pleurochrysis_carterae.AAC.1
MVIATSNCLNASTLHADSFIHLPQDVIYVWFNMWASLVQTSGDLPPRGRGMAHRQRRRRRLRAEEADVVAGEYA